VKNLLARHFQRISARREEIGDRELPRRVVYAMVAVVLAGGVAGMAIVVVGDSTVSLVAGCLVALIALGIGLALVIRAAHAAQRDG
jgi:hypothetical protein